MCFCSKTVLFAWANANFRLQSQRRISHRIYVLFAKQTNTQTDTNKLTLTDGPFRASSAWNVINFLSQLFGEKKPLAKSTPHKHPIEAQILRSLLFSGARRLRGLTRQFINNQCSCIEKGNRMVVFSNAIR